MIRLVRQVGEEITESKENLRQFLKKSWQETYQHQVGIKASSMMISALDDDCLAGILPANGEKVILCMDADSIIGSCVYATRQDATYMWGCYVQGSAQRSGIGRKMIELVLSDGDTGKVIQVTVLRVSVDAVRFYEKLGFTNTSNVNFELVPGHEESAFIMELEAENYLREPEKFT